MCVGGGGGGGGGGGVGGGGGGGGSLTHFLFLRGPILRKTRKTGKRARPVRRFVLRGL